MSTQLTSQNDVYFGTSGNDDVQGLAGNDFLFGNAGDDTLDGGANDDTISAGHGRDKLFGGSGIDTVSYANYSSGVFASLAQGTGYQLNLGYQADGDDLTGFENLTGSNYDDSLAGNNGANVIEGRGGNDLLQGQDGDDTLDGGAGNDVLQAGYGQDTLIGGSGTDTVSYALYGGGVTVSLTDGIGYRYSDNVAFDGDTLTGIENIDGSAYMDYLTGDGGDNVISGGQAKDQLYGLGGNDVLSGGEDNDVLMGGAGADALDGGSGAFDYASYNQASSGVTANLDTGSGNKGEATGDTFVGVEGFFGSHFNDKLTGDGNGNTFYGNAGDDELRGGGGNDDLSGDAGADTLIGGDGTDWASYRTADAGVTVNLATGLGSGGDAQGDTLTGIEDVHGSEFNDKLVGNSVDNALEGWGGNDKLIGAGGDDALDGGAGTDTLRGGAGADYLTGGADSDTFVFAALNEMGKTIFSHDRISDFTQGSDVISLSGVDANKLIDGNQAFSFIGDSSFSHKAGQLHYFNDAGHTVIAGDVNGDNVLDFRIDLDSLVNLTAGDFIL